MASALNVNTVISDFHNLIAFSSKMHVPKTANRNTQYRSYKHFDYELFECVIVSARYHASAIFDGVSDICWFNHTLIKMVLISMLHINQKGLLKDHYHLWILNYVKLVIENQCQETSIVNAFELSYYVSSIRSAEFMSPNWKLNPWRINYHKDVVLVISKEIPQIWEYY